VVADGFYRVSALLSGVGTEVQGEAWATAMHGSIARAILRFRTLSPMDVSTILFHATLARDWSAVTHLSLGIVNSDNETWEALAQGAGWFALVGTGEAIRPETDVVSLWLIRLLQLRLAAAGHNDKGAVSVIACMDEELPATVESAQMQMARYFFLGQVQLCKEINLPIAQLVSMGFEYLRLTDELKDVLANAHDAEFDRTLAGPDGMFDIGIAAAFTLIPHITDRHRLMALLETCEPVNTDVVRRLLWFFGGQESRAHVIFDRVWLSESGATTPDWLACREVFQRAYALARRWALPGLAQGAAQAIAHLTNESLNDPADALRLADAMEAEIGRSPGLDDERASILLRRGDTADALAIWRELLPRWTRQDQFDVQQLFSHRLAAVAAARLGEWIEAADWLRSARALGDDVNQATYCAGLLIDEGFARWKSGDNRGALDCLVEGVTAIDQLPADDADESAYLLRKRAHHVMTWIAETVAGTPPKDSEPQPALCSSLEPVKEAGAPSTPSDAMWVQVLKFEFFAELGNEQFHAHEARLKASRYGIVRFAFNGLRLQHRLRNLALDDFVEVVGDWTDSLALCQRHYGANGLGAADPLPTDTVQPNREEVDTNIVFNGMLSALFALAARGTITKEILNRLTASAVRADRSAIVAPWLSFVVAIFVDDTVKAETVRHDPSQAWPWQVVASIRVAVDTATRPAELLMVHNYWASNLPKMPTGLFVLADIEHLVTRAWRRLCENRFLLSAPTRTVPALEEACESASTGWSKIGEILTAACDVVPANVPSEMRKRFQELK
jgi:hypothetical protein